MYAIIQHGGKQLKVENGQTIDIDYRQASQGDQITFDRVLALSKDDDDLQLGAPTIEGLSVTAEVVGVKFGKKLVIRKLRKRKNSRRKKGHRQMYTTVRISAIGDVAAPAPQSQPASDSLSDDDSPSDGDSASETEAGDQ